MTTVTPRLPARFARYVSTIAAAAALTAAPLHAQQIGGWHPGIFVGGFAYPNNAAEGTANASLSRGGVHGALFADRWISPFTGVRVEANAMLVPGGNPHPIYCETGPGFSAPCPQPGGHMSAGGLELALLASPGGSAGDGAVVDVGLGVYRTFARPVGVAEPTTRLINVAGAHVGGSVPLAGPVRLQLRVQTLGGGVLRFAGGGGIGVVF